jgi:beta-1,4-mannosyltransferase
MAWPMVTPGNPYTEILYTNMKALGAEVTEFSVSELLRTAPSVWHLHWPDHVLNRPSALQAMIRGVAVLLLATVARHRGCKIVWTVHNLHSHERRHPKIEAWFWRQLVRRVDGYVSLSNIGRDLLLRQFPQLRRTPGFVVPLGHYRGVYPHDLTSQAARVRLGITDDTTVIGYFGHILTYKNVPHLIRVYRQLNRPMSVLLVAGEPLSPGATDAVSSAAEKDSRVRMFLHHVPPADVQVYLLASDLIVLPYRDILNSSSALLALSFDRPILVPRVGAMAELRERIGAEWVATYDGDLTASALEAAVEWARNGSRGPCRALDTLDWTVIASETLSAFRQVSGAGR